MRNLASNLRTQLETKNEEDRNSSDKEKRQRAENIDKIEEIYDKIIDKKYNSQEKDVFDSVKVDDKSTYFRITSDFNISRAVSVVPDERLKKL